MQLLCRGAITHWLRSTSGQTTRLTSAGVHNHRSPILCQHQVTPNLILATIHGLLQKLDAGQPISLPLEAAARRPFRASTSLLSIETTRNKCLERFPEMREGCTPYG